MPVDMNVEIAPGKDFSIVPIIGITLPKKNVLKLVTNCFIAGLTFCPIAMLPSRFATDAFIAWNEPLNVVDASFAAVPVKPRSCWIAWMAE